MKSTITCLLLFLGLTVAYSQEFPFGTAKWDVSAEGASAEVFKGKSSLYLYQGKARLQDFEFFTGILEYDIYVTERRGFPGIRFRIQDEGNWEEFYIRPHQSGNPDANQYTPVFNGLAAWQLYFGPRFSTAYAYQFDAWNHVKLVVTENELEVYINDMDTPMLTVDELKHAKKPGAIELYAGGPSGFRMADLKVTKMANPTIKGKAKQNEPLPEGLIESWSVSNAFDEQSLEGVTELSKQNQSGLSWQTVAAEERGYANLARVAVQRPKQNTVFAKVTIESDRKQVKKLYYGLSDRGTLFLNGQALASGYNEFRSQDYRHLGTIGFNDAVYLPLKKGTNELWVAVSENFGGWAVMGAFENTEGIKVE